MHAGKRHPIFMQITSVLRLMAFPPSKLHLPPFACEILAEQTLAVAARRLTIKCKVFAALFTTLVRRLRPMLSLRREIFKKSLLSVHEAWKMHFQGKDRFDGGNFKATTRLKANGY